MVRCCESYCCLIEEYLSSVYSSPDLGTKISVTTEASVLPIFNNCLIYYPQIFVPKILAFLRTLESVLNSFCAHLAILVLLKLVRLLLYLTICSLAFFASLRILYWIGGNFYL